MSKIRPPIPIIIVGQPKAGTSSLFNWLSKHDQICGSNVKETRFFIDNDYPLKNSNKSSLTVENYLKYFDIQDHKYILEATPDYLYNELTLGLHSLFENILIIIIKRDPIERLMSFYRYHKQQGLVSPHTTFDEYIYEQLRRKYDENRPLHLRSLEHSKEKYIDKFKEIYKEDCIVIEFSDLIGDPRLVVSRIFQKLELKPLKRGSNEFVKLNETVVSRNQTLTRIYRHISGFIRYRIHDKKSLMKILRPLSKYIRKHLFYASNMNRDVVSKEIIEKINQELQINVFKN